MYTGKHGAYITGSNSKSRFKPTKKKCLRRRSEEIEEGFLHGSLVLSDREASSMEALYH